MTSLQGHTYWAARLSTDANVDDDWTAYTLGETVGDKGGTAQVYRIAAKTTPPLLAKMYHSDSILQRIASDPGYGTRLMCLGMERATLNKVLPFCTWPRRLVFKQKDPLSDQVAGSIIGLTLPELATHVALSDVLRDKSNRTKMTHAHGIHIAVSLADQLHRLHTHPWRFVIGDLSPNNLLVDYTFSSIQFIDMDTVRFSPGPGYPTFDTPGTTVGYRSPEYFHAPSQGQLSAAHDDFVLAILLFQILMAMSGLDGVHPFLDADASEDDNIRQARFPYVDALRPTQVADAPAAAYAAWDPNLRTAFEDVFTGRKAMTAKQWADLLSNYRRSLR